VREREERGITASLTVVHDCVFSSGILSLPIFLGIWRIEGDESGVTQVTAFPLSLSLSLLGKAKAKAEGWKHLCQPVGLAVFFPFLSPSTCQTAQTGTMH